MLVSGRIKSSVYLGQNEAPSNKLLFTSVFQLELNVSCPQIPLRTPASAIQKCSLLLCVSLKTSTGKAVLHSNEEQVALTRSYFCRVDVINGFCLLLASQPSRSKAAYSAVP